MEKHGARAVAPSRWSRERGGSPPPAAGMSLILRSRRSPGTKAQGRSAADESVVKPNTEPKGAPTTDAKLGTSEQEIAASERKEERLRQVGREKPQMAEHLHWIRVL